MSILPLLLPGNNQYSFNDDLLGGFILRVASWGLVTLLIFGLHLFIPALSQFKWLDYIGAVCMAIGLIHGSLYVAKSP